MSQRHAIVVTIDGPAGAGKSTVAKELARRLDYRLLDTGALYRLVALLARRRGIGWDDSAALAGICHALDVRFEMQDDINHIIASGEDVTKEIRLPEISRGASHVSALPPVRAALLDVQRRLGAGGGVVVEGRDTGTVVFPHAQAKFFLTASDDVRARRRHEELLASGSDAGYSETLHEMRARDERDSSRAVAPMAVPADAVRVDSSGMTLDQVVDKMLAIVRQREENEPH